MESTFAQRVLSFRKSKQLSQSAFAEQCGLEQGNISQMEKGTEPKRDNVSRLLEGFPDLNPDWLLLGKGPMLRDGKALTPVVTEELQRPAPMQTVPGQIDFTYRYITSMEQQVAAGLEREADQRAQIEELLEMLKKPLGNLDFAAAEPEATYTPAPRNPIGYQINADKKPECVVRGIWTSDSVEVTPSYAYN